MERAPSLAFLVAMAAAYEVSDDDEDFENGQANRDIKFIKEKNLNMFKIMNRELKKKRVQSLTKEEIDFGKLVIEIFAYPCLLLHFGQSKSKFVGQQLFETLDVFALDSRKKM